MCFRLNFSHGTQEDHRVRHELIRSLEQRYGRPIAIMADLQGPKIRIGRLEGGAVELEEGKHFRLDMEKAPGDSRRAPLPHPEIFAAIGQRPSSCLTTASWRCALNPAALISLIPLS
jgi:pyruvate kinase